MSSRFHDKWHGANHNSVSAIGIPDSGRDPIGSYIFPFEGEFIMNNSPRHNGGENKDSPREYGMGHSDYSSKEIYDKWVLSSNRIDTNVIRSQQDEPWGEIVLSAKHQDNAQESKMTLRGSHNHYNLEVNGPENSIDFIAGVSANWESIGENLPMRKMISRVGYGELHEIREYSDGDKLIHTKAVVNTSGNENNLQSIVVMQPETIGIYVADTSGSMKPPILDNALSRSAKRRDAHYDDGENGDSGNETIEPRTEDIPEESRDDLSSYYDKRYNEPLKRNLAIEMDGPNHSIKVKAGKLNEVYNSNTGNYKLTRHDGLDGTGFNAERDEIAISEDAEHPENGEISIKHHYTKPNEIDQWIGIKVKGPKTYIDGTSNVDGEVFTSAHNLSEYALSAIRNTSEKYVTTSAVGSINEISVKNNTTATTQAGEINETASGGSINESAKDINEIASHRIYEEAPDVYTTAGNTIYETAPHIIEVSNDRNGKIQSSAVNEIESVAKTINTTAWESVNDYSPGSINSNAPLIAETTFDGGQIKMNAVGGLVSTEAKNITESAVESIYEHTAGTITNNASKISLQAINEIEETSQDKISFGANTGIYFNGHTSVTPYRDEQFYQIPELLPSETIRQRRRGGKKRGITTETTLATDHLLVSSSQNDTADTQIWFKNSQGWIPNLYSRNIYAKEATFSSFSALSGVVKYVDIVESDLSGFIVRGERLPTEYHVNFEQAIAPPIGVLYLSGAGLWGDRWGYIGNDFMIGRNLYLYKNMETSADAYIHGRMSVGRPVYPDGYHVSGGPYGNNKQDPLLGYYDMIVYGNELVDGNTDIAGNTTTSGNLNVSGNSNTKGDVAVTGNSTLTGYLHTSSNLQVAQWLSAGGNATLASNLNVSGDSTLKGYLHTSSNLQVAQWLSAGGNATLASNLSVSGDSTLKGYLHTSSNLQVANWLSAGGDATLASNLNVSGDSTLKGYLHTSSNLRVAESLSAGGNATLASNLNVSGDSTLKGYLHTSSNLQVANWLSAGGDAILASNLNVSGDSTLNGNLRVKSNSYMENGLSVTGHLFVDAQQGSSDEDTVCELKKTVIIPNYSTFTEPILSQTANSTLYVVGKSTVSGDVAISGDTTINGSTTINGNTVFNNDLYMADGKSIYISNGNISGTGIMALSGMSEDEPALNVYGNVFVASAISANEIYIQEPDGGFETQSMSVSPRYIPLSVYLGQIEQKAKMAARSAMVRTAQKPDAAARIVSVADVVDEARRVSYVAAADHVENVNISQVDYAKNVSNAVNLQTAAKVLNAGFVKNADTVNMYGKIGSAFKVEIAENLTSAECASTVASASYINEVEKVQTASGVENASDIMNANRVYTAENADCITKSNYTEFSNVVNCASRVNRIKTLDGHELRGPAIVPSAPISNDGIIKVTEWKTLYKSKSNDITLEGLAKGWSDINNQLVFTVEIQRTDNMIYNISISADKPIQWIGESTDNRMFEYTTFIEFRVDADEILAKIL